MALQKTATTQWGLEVADAHHRVEGIQLNKTQASFWVRSYANTNEQIWFAEKNYMAPYDIDAANPWVQAYEFAKTQPEWADAQDC
jgi:hypothetical protein